MMPEMSEQINGIIHAHMGGEAKQIRSAAERIVKMLVSSGLAYVNRCQCVNVGTHNQNRDGTGLDVEKVHQLILLICNQGWVWEEVRNAWAFELPPGEEGDEQYRFNVALAESADGYLAPWTDKNMLRFLSVTSSHTIAGIRCVKCRFGSKSLQDAISTDGRVSRDRVYDLAPSYLEPVDNGMDWTIIRHEVATACPLLPHFLQEPGNAGHGTQQLFSKIQTLLRIHSRAKFMGNDWDKVTAAVEKNSPHLQGHVRGMCDLVAEYSGGTPPIYLQDLEKWAKTLKTSKDVDGRSFKMLSAIPFKQGPECIIGMLKAMVASPDAFVRGGVSRLLTSSDASDVVGKKKADCLSAASYAKTGREWLQGSAPQLEEHVVSKLVGDFQIRCVMHVHGKKAPGRATFKGIGDIAMAFLEDVFAAAPDLKSSGDLPWDCVARSPKDDGKTKKQEIVQFSGGGGGLDKAALAQLGFEVGQDVTMKTDASNALTIASIDDGRVTFEIDGRHEAKKPHAITYAKL
ncbi:unnamed protein product, partial [Prorocentrum cordatum]